jgi:hypothetical protein
MSLILVQAAVQKEQQDQLAAVQEAELKAVRQQKKEELRAAASFAAAEREAELRGLGLRESSEDEASDDEDALVRSRAALRWWPTGSGRGQGGLDHSRTGRMRMCTTHLRCSSTPWASPWARWRRSILARGGARRRPNRRLRSRRSPRWQPSRGSMTRTPRPLCVGTMRWRCSTDCGKRCRTDGC